MIARLLASPTAAHVLPLVLFTLLNSVPGLFRIENSELPWHVRAPEHWVYPLQTVLCAMVLILFRKHYTFKPWRGLGLAFALGIVGILVWIAPSLLRDSLIQNGHAPASWWDWLGLAERNEGFDPTIAKDSSWLFGAVVVMRFARMVLVVPFVEELFWRGFLMRFLLTEDGRFERVAFGTHRRKVFWIVTVAVMLIHNTEDYVGAFVWGSLVYFLAVRSKSLGACVFMHAVGNLALGLYVMNTQQWGFW
ncbi:CAAX prenyl protease-related protein [Prosthecobacter sp.]|uniref:CAAX prenyl protease-related protein n=1 Tax=Prosthecobacter sp. TaxID=1965333 RepID=UPI001D5357F1|nr:CAAX prenyl protease-related protein [Prosthecobacter sp.]MCB1279095.1 CAAX prenyl protease-related protein [Prosthecobacter sp.]